MTKKAQFWQKLYQWHMYVGLFVAVHFMIFAITGLLLIFKDDLQAKPEELVKIQDVKQNFDSLQYQKIYENWRSTNPDGKLHALFPQDEQERIIHLRYRTDGRLELRGALRASYDLITGEKIEQLKTKQKKFWDFVLILHRDLFLGSTGKLYLGLVGILYLLMLFSGLILYGRFMRFRHFGQIRISTVFRLVDLHKFLGVITWGWAVLVAFTGVLLAFNAILIKFFQLRTLNFLAAKVANRTDGIELTHVSLGEIIKICKEIRPQALLEYISFPGTEYGIPGQFLILMESTTKMSQTLTEIVMIDASTGQVTEIVTPPLILKILLFSEPLHFANYGGLALKVIWAIMTLLSMVVVGLGVTSFIVKRLKIKLKFSPQDRNTKVIALSFAQHYKWPFIIISLSLLSVLAFFFLSPLWSQ